MLLFLIVTGMMSNLQFAAAQFDGLGGEPKPCPPFRCASDDSSVPKWPLQLESPGCTGAGSMQILNNQGGEEDDALKACCDLRHACIQTCGSLKIVCEQDFIKCGEAACISIDDGKKNQQCTQNLQVQKLMTSLDNCNTYNQEQYKHCKCVPKAKAHEARVDLLTKFYLKHNPQNVSKVKGLAEKADTARKLSTLLIKLVRKYPESIKKIKDPQQERMEKMMRDTSEKEEDEMTEELNIDEL
jgi:hypothetical protein